MLLIAHLLNIRVNSLRALDRIGFGSLHGWLHLELLVHVFVLFGHLLEEVITFVHDLLNCWLCLSLCNLVAHLWGREIALMRWATSPAIMRLSDLTSFTSKIERLLCLDCVPLSLLPSSLVTTALKESGLIERRLISVRLIVVGLRHLNL